MFSDEIDQLNAFVMAIQTRADGYNKPNTKKSMTKCPNGERGMNKIQRAAISRYPSISAVSFVWSTCENAMRKNNFFFRHSFTIILFRNEKFVSGIHTNERTHASSGQIQCHYVSDWVRSDFVDRFILFIKLFRIEMNSVCVCLMWMWCALGDAIDRTE